MLNFSFIPHTASEKKIFEYFFRKFTLYVPIATKRIKRFLQKLKRFGLTASEEKSFENVDDGRRRRTDDG